MDPLPQIPLLKISPEVVAKIRQDFDLDIKKINENIDIIEEWCKKQAHLQEASQYLDRNSLERLHILSKGSVEMTKIKIDKILTTRTLLPEIFLNKSLEEFENFANDVMFIMLPNLSPVCQSRIFVSRLVNKNMTDYNLLTHIRYACLVEEFRLHFEYSMRDRFIFDLKHVNMNLVTKMNLMLLKKAEILGTEIYGTKIKGLHFINAPPFVDKIIFLCKQVLKEKMWKRIHVHSSYEELHKEIPKEVLPEELGGDAPSSAKIAEQWKEFFKTEEAKRISEIANKLVSDETKRCTAKFNEEYLGMPGTFRKLNVD